MKTYHRPFVYDRSDFKRMCALLVRDNACKRESFVWHIAPLVDWKYNLYNFKRRFPGNYAGAAHLWFNYYDELVGFVISEEFNEQFDIILLDEYGHLYPEILAWARAKWGPQHRQLITSAADAHVRRIAALEQAGYQRTGEVEMTVSSIRRNFVMRPTRMRRCVLSAWQKIKIRSIRGSYGAAPGLITTMTRRPTRPYAPTFAPAQSMMRVLISFWWTNLAPTYRDAKRL